MLQIEFMSTWFEIALRWMPQNIFDYSQLDSTLVPVMAWCHKATSHYLNQCWPRFVSPYGVTRLQWLTHAVLNLFLGNMNIWLHFLLSFLTYQKDPGSCNASPWKRRTCFYCIVNIVIADGMAMQADRASTSMVFTYLILISASEVLYVKTTCVMCHCMHFYRQCIGFDHLSYSVSVILVDA